VSIAAVVWIIGGLGGALYFLLLALAVAPGLPLGFALFGRAHAAGWIAGLLLGYALTSIAWWAVVYARFHSGAAFIAAWAVTGLAAWVIARRVRGPAVALPAWTGRTTRAFLLVLLIVPALVAQPFDKLGSRDADGNRLYRAYFIADFVWHAALTAEMAKETQPPRNPYLASQPVHYYWTYFRVPATLVRHAGFDVQTALKLNAVAAALLLVSAVYLAAWAAFPAWPFLVALATLLTITCPSAEGFAAAFDLLRRGHPLGEFRDLNVDAIAAWAFKGLRIDDLPRAMWYTPQHSISYALGLLAIPVALAAGVRARAAAIALAGVALGASLTFNPLVGAFFCAVYGLTVLVDAVRTRAAAVAILRHGLAIVPVLIAYAWCAFNEVGEGAFSALHFGFWGPARNATAIVFLLSFGPILVPMAVGLWPWRTPPLASVWPAVIGILLSVLLMHLVTLTVDQFWVGFRAGHLFFVVAPAIVARGFVALWQRGRPGKAVALAIMGGVAVVGYPTTALDAYNAQDVANLKMGPGFHWTVTVSAAEQEALDWIRTKTPPDAIVQMEPTVRGRETWTLIPTFAERRMAAGNALPLLNIPEYAEKSELVRQIYAGRDAKAARTIADRLRIDYLYADRTERTAYPDGVAKFDAHPEYFTRVFANHEATIYAVRR
jgi:hypothetical protein